MQFIDLLFAGFVALLHWMDSDDISYVVLETAIPALIFVIAYSLTLDKDHWIAYLLKIAFGVGLVVAGDWFANALAGWLANVEVTCNNATHDPGCERWSPDSLGLAVMVILPLVAIVLTSLLRVRPFFVGFLACFVVRMTVFGLGFFGVGRFAQ